MPSTASGSAGLTASETAGSDLQARAALAAVLDALEGGTALHEIAVVVPRLADVWRTFDATFAEAGIDLAFATSAPWAW